MEKMNTITLSVKDFAEAIVSNKCMDMAAQTAAVLTIKGLVGKKMFEEIMNEVKKANQ